MIYATGDLHGNSLRFLPQYFPEQSEMTKDDYMIVCGDFGCVWRGDKSDDPQLDRLEALPFTILFVDGNHVFLEYGPRNEPVVRPSGNSVRSTASAHSADGFVCLTRQLPGRHGASFAGGVFPHIFELSVDP